LFFLPFNKSDTPAFRSLGFGVSGSYESTSLANLNGLPSTTGGLQPGYYTDGQLQFFAYNPADNAVVVAKGQHWRLSPQAYYYFGPFGLLGEYVISDQEVHRTLVAPLASAQLRNTAWQVAASWLVTGEKAGYDTVVVPKHPFNPQYGEWGAVQLVARYMQLNVDNAAFPLFSNPSTSAQSATAWSVGVTWFLNRNFSMNLDFSHTWFNGGGGPGIIAPATVTRTDENVLFTRIQLAF
jgi:phosphate-selective porin OprO/OprP